MRILFYRRTLVDNESIGLCWTTRLLGIQMVYLGYFTHSYGQFFFDLITYTHTCRSYSLIHPTIHTYISIRLD